MNLSLRRLGTGSNPDAKRLYDDLISRYNKLVRPVMNVSEPLTVHIKLKLSQLIEVVSSPTQLITWLHFHNTYHTHTHYRASREVHG